MLKYRFASRNIDRPVKMNRMKITKCNIYGGMKMKEFKYVITDNEGIHARPAGELVKLAKSFEASVMIEKEGKKADCKKIFGLMGLEQRKVMK